MNLTQTLEDLKNHQLPMLRQLAEQVIHPKPSSWDHLIESIERVGGIVECIEFLREAEGNSVTINCSNPEFDGPMEAVECCGDFTDWEDKRFTGNTLLSALQFAVLTRKEFLSAVKP